MKYRKSVKTLFCALLLSSVGTVSSAETCMLSDTYFGEERKVRITSETDGQAQLAFLTSDGTWEADPEIGTLFCGDDNICRSQDQAERGVDPTAEATIALSRKENRAAYAEWRKVNDEIIQWVFLMALDCQ